MYRFPAWETSSPPHPNSGGIPVRHSYGTAALEAGINPKIVSERLGHAGVSITLDVYSHATRALSEEAAGKVARHILTDRTLTND